MIKKYNLKNNRSYRKMLRRQRKQIVILLGAGAAMDWGGSSSKSIKDLFVNDQTYIIVDGRTVGRFIFDHLESFYGHDCSNFETFIAALETILNYVISDTNDGAINHSNTSFIPSIFNLKSDIIRQLDLEEKSPEEKRVCCYELYKHYVNIVIRKIDTYNSNIFEATYDEVNSNLEYFTKYFLNRGYSVKYYTTNYDNIIPQIFKNKIEIYEGLYKSNLLSRRFNYNLANFRKARLSHFNLHGSIFLSQTMIKSSIIERETIYNSFAQEISTGLTLDAGNPSELLFFSPIITGYNKTQRMVNKPFNLGFSAFTNDCNDCSAIISVGYSFSDPHINSILSSFTSLYKAKYLHITKCDTFPDIESHPMEQITKVYNSQIEDETWLYNVNNQKSVYKKGFAEFLMGKENWEYLI